ncbi:MAG: hypothetical protein GY906_35920 [bacterium]|nr:hypothetical protein [bacterium]
MTEAVTSVVDRAVAGGAPACKLLVIADESGSWLRQFSRLARDERGQAVVAVKRASQLACAQRLGFGGAFRLPPSIGSVTAALHAASRPLFGMAVTCLADAEALQTCTERRLSIVMIENRSFWYEQMGEGVLRRLLAALAGRLSAPSVVLPWPALIVGDISIKNIRREWGELTSDGCLPGEPVVMHLGTAQADRRDPIRAAYRKFEKHDTENSTTSQPKIRPVHNLPQGDRIGWWCTDRPGSLCEGGWTASPNGRTPAGFKWRLDTHEGESQFVPDLVDPDEVSHFDGPAVRIPPWATRGLHSGTVAHLLIDAVAKEADREGKAVWISRVCSVALGEILRRGGRWWVDGRAVPGE